MLLLLDGFTHVTFIQTPLRTLSGEIVAEHAVADGGTGSTSSADVGPAAVATAARTAEQARYLLDALVSATLHVRQNSLQSFVVGSASNGHAGSNTDEIPAAASVLVMRFEHASAGGRDVVPMGTGLGAAVLVRPVQSSRWFDCAVLRVLQKRQTLMLPTQPTPPTVLHDVSVITAIPASASSFATTNEHVGDGGTGALEGNTETGAGAGVPAGAGAVVESVRSAQLTKPPDCTVFRTRQKRHTSLTQPRPPLLHNTSVAILIPAAASPGETCRVQAATLKAPPIGAEDGDVVGVAGGGVEAAGGGAPVVASGTGGCAGVAASVVQSSRCWDCGVLLALQYRHTDVPPRQPIPSTTLHVPSVAMEIPTPASPGDTTSEHCFGAGAGGVAGTGTPVVPTGDGVGEGTPEAGNTVVA